LYLRMPCIWFLQELLFRFTSQLFFTCFHPILSWSRLEWKDQIENPDSWRLPFFQFFKITHKARFWYEFVIREASHCTGFSTLSFLTRNCLFLDRRQRNIEGSTYLSLSTKLLPCFACRLISDSFAQWGICKTNG
jgi:hypothetical protein